jgi:chromate transporter
MKGDARKLVRMFLTFFRIGAFTIGGGYAMLPLIEREFVEKQGWVSEDEIVDIFAIVQSVPGVIAINSSIFIGYRIAGLAGALAATLGMVLPSFIIISVIAAFFVQFRDIPAVQNAFAGIRAGVTALIALAAFRLGRKVMTGFFPIAVGIVAFAALLIFDVHAIAIIAVSAAAGLIRYRLLPWKG